MIAVKQPSARFFFFNSASCNYLPYLLIWWKSQNMMNVLDILRFLTITVTCTCTEQWKKNKKQKWPCWVGLMWKQLQSLATLNWNLIAQIKSFKSLPVKGVCHQRARPIIAPHHCDLTCVSICSALLFGITSNPIELMGQKPRSACLNQSL